jgi:hypothetical protein
MRLPDRPLSSDIAEYRDRHECGLVEAREAILRQWRARALDTLADNTLGVADPHAKDIIRELISLVREINERS